MPSKGSWKLFGIILLSSIPLIATISIGISRQVITPNDQFFVTSKGPSPDVNASTWELTLNGTVATDLHYSYQNFTDLPSVELKATLQCVEGPSGTAIWKGVWLRDLLTLAGYTNDSFDVVFRAVDGFSSSLTIEEAFEDDVLLAYEMNGVPLPRDHGFPLRVVAPHHWGYKWVKWISNIEVVDYDYRGFWESRGWADDAHLTLYSDWGVHAMLFSVAILFGGISFGSGKKFDRKIDTFKDLPKFVNRKFHQVSSLAYITTGITSFGYWLIVTYLKKGTVFYSIHGIFALISIILLAAMGFSGYFKSRAKEKFKSGHKTIAFFNLFLFVVTTFFGFIMALFGAPAG